MVGKRKECILCYPEGNIKNIIKGYEPDAERENPWVFVPREPEAFGHLVVVAGKHYLDISDKELAKDTKHLIQMLKLISKLCVKMKKHLKFDERVCKKVYVSTLCETDNMHLHFHLIPRFDGDRTGFKYLFEKELEGTRWMLQDSNIENKIRKGYYTTLDAGTIIDFHKYLFSSNKWVRSNEDRESFINEIKKKIEEIIID